jgi:hypothetical protein
MPMPDTSIIFFLVFCFLLAFALTLTPNEKEQKRRRRIKAIRKLRKQAIDFEKKEKGVAMPDITMCENSLCPLRRKCERFMAKPSPFQAYDRFAPDENGECNMFMEVER